LALTGLTPAEFDLLLPAFSRSYGRLYPAGRTLAGRLRKRLPGAGRTGALHTPQQKLLLVLVYLKTYPLPIVMAELFNLSQPQVNYWLRRLLPVLRDALDELDVLPERDPHAFTHIAAPPLEQTRRIIDGTERRRQRPKNPEKQRAHSSGRKKTHSDKNVVVTDADSGRVEYLSQTYPGRAADKAIADWEGITYPPGTVLYKDSGFQGYEPAGAETHRAKKKAARRGVDGGREAHESHLEPHPGKGGTRAFRGEALPHRQGRVAEHGGGGIGFGHGGGLWAAQPSSREAPTTQKNLTIPNENLISENV
jgi:Helix-turn-helix of DDE superfamily endonuclease/DDE superfamily endonuclease